MSLKIDGDKFYVLKTPNEKWIYSKEDDAIEALRERFLSKDVKPEDVAVLEVLVKGNEWEIVQIPWSRIAFKLIKRGEKRG